ncbi:MAG: hypothetical protein KGN00_09985 [Chloroflexota bacterium]|nr:hypothetical protein [Chloroflexota bacterium]
MDDFDFGDEMRDRLVRVLVAHGAVGPFRRAYPAGGDELVIILTPEGAARVDEGAVTTELTALLKRKVAVTTAPPWPAESVPL